MTETFLGLTRHEICVYGFMGPVVIINLAGLIYFVTKWIWYDNIFGWGE